MEGINIPEDIIKNLKNIKPKTEMIKGKLKYMSPSGNIYHGMTITNFSYALRQYIEKTKKNCVVFIDGLDLYYNSENYVTPDVAVVCDLDKIVRDKYTGTPSLVMECLSKSTKEWDEKDKLGFYESLKIKEYVIIDPYYTAITQYALVNDKYEQVGFYPYFDPDELKSMHDDGLKNYLPVYKSYAFSDLEIELKRIFEYFK